MQRVIKNLRQSIVQNRVQSVSSITDVQTVPIYCKRHPPPAFLKTPRIKNYSLQTSKTTLPRKIRVLVDMDGVLADFEKALINIYKEEAPNLPVLPSYLRKGLCIDKQYDEYFGQDWQEKCGDKLRDIMMRENFFRDLPPIPEAVNKVHCLLDNPNFDVSICTAPLTHNAFCTSEKLEWIERYFGRRFHRKVIMTNDKTLINADFLLDDKEQICGALGDDPSFVHILVRQEHNQHITCHDRKNILENWNNLDDLLETLINENVDFAEN